MRCPVLGELSPLPSGKMGWPWSEGTPRLPEMMADGRPWPLISIVTPSYNQGRFIEGTIRSVLLQGYPNLEYIIIDGGSTDGSLEIIRKYAKWLAYWASEPDKGQAHAINKGFQRASGQILAWLNSDDQYCTKTLHVVARHFRDQPDIGLLFGDCTTVDAEGVMVDYVKGKQGDLAHLLMGNFIPQPSAFFHRRAWQAVGGLDVDLHFALDYELWIRMMLAGVKSHYTPVSLSQFRWHDASKSRNYLAQFGFEYLAILERVFGKEQDERFRGVKLHAYHQGFRMIDAVYQQGIDEGKNHQGEILRMAELWACHLDKHRRDYTRNPRLWAESLYHIGKNYCLLGHMPEGRRYFAMALHVNKRAYKALVGLAIASLGVNLYRSYTRVRHCLLRMLIRLNKEFPRTYCERVHWRKLT
jgi:glycosyltransferase involved in cell wall biosynthesis